jgi:hypothetical protein
MMEECCAGLSVMAVLSALIRSNQSSPRGGSQKSSTPSRRGIKAGGQPNGANGLCQHALRTSSSPISPTRYFDEGARVGRARKGADHFGDHSGINHGGDADAFMAGIVVNACQPLWAAGDPEAIDEGVDQFDRFAGAAKPPFIKVMPSAISASAVAGSGIALSMIVL